MHIFTHLKKESQGKTGLGVYPDGMVEHDGHVGKLLDKLDELGIADNTIVMYSTDNGAEVMSWPDGGTTPFRGEKDTNWEGGWRVPCAIRWPGVIKPGTVSNEIFSHTGHAADAGRGGRRARRRREAQEGLQVGQQDLQGPHRRLQPAAVSEGRGEGESAQGLLYWSDDGDLMALRVGNWKATFMEQRAHGFGVWQEPLGRRCASRRSTTCEATRSSGATKTRSMFYDKWMVDRAFLLVPAQAIVGRVPQDVQGVPAAPEAGELQHRPGAGEGAREREAAGRGERRRREVVRRSECVSA